LRHYLRVIGGLIDLSGRLAYQLEETINDAAYRAAAQQPMREKLLDILIRHNSSTGAEVMSWLLIDPPADSANKALPATLAAKHKTLQLIARTGSTEVSSLLARVIREERRYPDLVIAAADVLRQVGFPQDPRPGDTAELSRPPITAAQLLPILRQLPARSLDARTVKLRDELIKWSEASGAQGLIGDSYPFGSWEIRPGDWMLARSPSPYNRFTDLSPGLFTHVGVAAVEKGSDGRRRMVIVDLTVKGTQIRATNIDWFLRQYHNYLFLRHPDATTARTMAGVARSIIGNEAVFDLNYRIDNVVALKGQPKEGKVIKSYCAGLLLLCGQETRVDRSRLFPFSEKVAGGKTAKNLKDLGISFGDNFVSPTGPLFSQEFTVVGRRPPLYDPAVEVEETIYDHFADCLGKYDLAASRDTFQQVRLTLAEASKENPALARMLAQLNNVNPAMDLVSAAKAAAMLEHLDRAALGNSRQFTDAFFALTCGPFEGLKAAGYTDKDIERFRMLREHHGELYRQLAAGKIDEPQVRRALIAYYVRQGKSEIEKRFKIEPAERLPG
jgi:hypothetical protein